MIEFRSTGLNIITLAKNTFNNLYIFYEDAPIININNDTMILENLQDGVLEEFTLFVSTFTNFNKRRASIQELYETQPKQLSQFYFLFVLTVCNQDFKYLVEDSLNKDLMDAFKVQQLILQYFTPTGKCQEYIEELINHANIDPDLLVVYVYDPVNLPQFRHLSLTKSNQLYNSYDEMTYNDFLNKYKNVQFYMEDVDDITTCLPFSIILQLFNYQTGINMEAPLTEHFKKQKISYEVFLQLMSCSTHSKKMEVGDTFDGFDIDTYRLPNNLNLNNNSQFVVNKQCTLTFFTWNYWSNFRYYYLKFKLWVQLTYNKIKQTIKNWEQTLIQKKKKKN
jgi:hypothetical protein